MGRRQRRREEAAEREAAELAELAGVRMQSADLPPDPLARHHRIQTVSAFLDALYELREACAREPSARSGFGAALTYGTSLADDGRLYAAAHVRLSLEQHDLLDRLERVWADLQPEERRVLHLQRDRTYAAILDALLAEHVRTAYGQPVTLNWVHARIKRAHERIEQHPVFRSLGTLTVGVRA